MEKYSIFCTEEQTRKALGLGAPIIPKCQIVHYLDGGYSYEIAEKDGEPILETPTAEQMIGWLEEHGDISMIEVSHAYKWYYRIFNKEYWEKMKHTTVYNSRKEATLAAIDAALDYLSNIKEK